MGAQGNPGGSSLGGALGGASLLQYDTGLFRAQRSLVRQHIAAKLSPLLVANGGYLHKIGTLPAPIKGRSDEELGPFVVAMNGRSPCVLIALGRKTYEYVGTTADEGRAEIEVSIYAVSSQARSFVDGRLDTDAIATGNPAADPGIETLLEHIEQLIDGQELDLQTASEMRAIDEDEVVTYEDVTIWEQRYQLYVQKDINVNRSIADVVSTVAVLNNLDGADAVNPVVETITTLEVP